MPYPSRDVQPLAHRIPAAVCRREVECWRSGSGREACEALGWKLCRPYLLKVCDAAKITLRKEKEETGEVRYFGRRRAVRAKAQPKVQEAADGQK